MPWAALSGGRQQLRKLPRLQEVKREGPGDLQDQRVQCWAGLGASPETWGGVGWVRPVPPQTPTPPALKTTPVYLGAGQETYWLPLLPSQTVGSGMGREWAWGSDPLHNFLQMGQSVPREDWSSLPRRGESPAQALGSSAGKGSSERRVPGAAPALSPHRHTPI